MKLPVPSLSVRLPATLLSPPLGSDPLLHLPLLCTHPLRSQGLLQWGEFVPLGTSACLPLSVHVLVVKPMGFSLTCTYVGATCALRLHILQFYARL